MQRPTPSTVPGSLRPINLRKIYLLVDGPNIASVDGLRRIFAVEAVLREFALIDGKFEDVHIIAITRDDLRSFLARPHIMKWLRHSTALRGSDDAT